MRTSSRGTKRMPDSNWMATKLVQDPNWLPANLDAMRPLNRPGETPNCHRERRVCQRNLLFLRVVKSRSFALLRMTTRAVLRKPQSFNSARDDVTRTREAALSVSCAE